MIKVIAVDSEFESAQKLGYETFRYTDNRAAHFNNEVVIRWGHGGYIFDDKRKVTDFKNVINRAKSIKQNCEKKEALLKMASVVKTPIIYEKRVPRKKLAVVRETCHSYGFGFEVKKGPVKIPTHHYATQFIKTKTEFRVWFCNSKTITAQRITKTKIGKFPCRSNWNYKFLKTPINLHNQTLRAAKAIGLEFGAADVLYYKRKYYFLELNSAPTLDTAKIVRFFKMNLANLIKQKFPALTEHNPVVIP